MLVLSRGLRLYLSGLLLTVLCSSASALEVALVLNRGDGVFARFAESFRNSASAAGVQVIDGGVVGLLRHEAIDRADWVVAAGEGAAEAVLALSDDGPPILLSLSARAQYLSLRQRHPARHISAVVLDQPPERHLTLISLLLPQARRVGCLLGPASASVNEEFASSAASAGLDWAASSVSAGAELARALERVLRDSDVFLAVPDTLLSTPGSARAILLTSYRYRRPVIGFSRAYVDAGALAAVFSTPEHNGRDSADWIAARLSLAEPEPGYVWPARFEVATNPQVARSLSIELGNMDSLAERLAASIEETAP